ncbi:MAG: hypothetical protein JNN08_17190 [Bryobacterales bacterium]|nr:hypothetical protein [Bryobacterales bacterium]
MEKHLGLVACLVVLLTLPIPAQFAPGLAADIPFGFYAGDQWLPAGKYEFFAEGRMVTLWSPDRFVCHVLVLGGPQADKSDRPSIAFTKYSSDRIFLARLHNPIRTVAHELVKSKREREVVSSRVVSQNKPETVVILARLSR